jgi:hypothetical protein
VPGEVRGLALDAQPSDGLWGETTLPGAGIAEPESGRAISFKASSSVPDVCGPAHPPGLALIDRPPNWRTPLNDLVQLLARLQQAQRDLIVSVAKTAMMPSDGTLRKIADLENTIAAVEALIQEERAKNRPQQAA